jgi:ABC-type molybdate transport system permease subunit
MVKKNIDNDKSVEYLENERFYDEKIVRTELLAAPLLVFIPMLIGFLLVYDWYVRDFLENNLNLFSELVLGFIIIIGNVLFDIPFIRSLKKFKKEKNQF